VAGEGCSKLQRKQRFPSDKEDLMYVAVREYKVKPGQIDRIVQRVRDDVAPLIQQISGFVGYTFAIPSDTEVASISFFLDRNGIDESTRVAAESVKRLFADAIEGPPRVSSGEVILRAGDPARQAHFGIMRRFSITPEQVSATLPKVREGLVPILTASPGFVAYSVADCGNGTVISLAAFESREAAEATSQRAMAWAEQAMEGIPDPEVIRAEIRLRIVNTAVLAQS
jgi:heme-degrading monooxygenase HmoA